MIYWRTRVRRYALLFQGRTGSSYLTEMFWSDPRIRAFGEQMTAIRQRGGTAEEQLRWARRALTPPWLGRRAVVGIKAQLREVLDPDGFAALLRGMSVRIIRMRRRNAVKLAASEINAHRLYEACGKWNIHSAGDRLPPMRVAAEELRTLLEERRRKEEELTDFIRRAGLPTLEVFYEDLCRDREGALARIFAFFGIAPRPLRGTMLKLTSDDLRQVFSNFDELRAAFTGTPYGAMFDERPGVVR